ncbi:MAG: TfoX/Sxy family protein [Saprospiraceae bacterium]|nr:TfoX/Sxy family protein [Saprospiraceae bacterium]
MAVDQEYFDYIVDQLELVQPIETKRMFGGVGIFKAGKMFAMIAGDTFRLKVDASNQDEFEKVGMKPFHSSSKKKGMPYWEVPISVLEDRDQLAFWANKSIEIALKKK